MKEIIIKQVPVGDFEVFTYVVACPETREASIIDPAGEPDKILSIVEEEDLGVRYILNTHGHPDHVIANERLKEESSASLCMHKEDVAFFSDPEIRDKVSRELGVTCETGVDMELEDGQMLDMGNLRIKVIHTPGHTPGSCCFLCLGNLFTGDTLFVGAAGRTDLAGGSLEGLLGSIEHKLLVLPKDTVVWPGHDYGETPTSTIGREMKENIYITDFLEV